MSLGLLITGIVIAVIGYCLERFFTGLITTLGKVLVIVGVVIAFIGLILWVVALAGASLLLTSVA